MTKIRAVLMPLAMVSRAAASSRARVQGMAAIISSNAASFTAPPAMDRLEAAALSSYRVNHFCFLLIRASLHHVSVVDGMLVPGQEPAGDGGAVITIRA